MLIAIFPAKRMSASDLPSYIAVEGPIGVGKTSLANRLAETFGYETLLEPTAEHVLLERFYRDQRRHAFSTQLFFLLHRAEQAAYLESQTRLQSPIVADFILEKDRLFAELTLDGEELRLYQQVAGALNIHWPQPDLVIYLQAPPRILFERVHRRGIEAENDCSIEYLTQVSQTYTNFFHRFELAPLLVVDASECNFADVDRHFQALLECIHNMRGRRHYFRLNPSLLD
ncbi:MAG: deoxynucleoside kinase [Gammaproteobacteria bacterium]|nr:deoxynucleoside kinase [Gammaproteobacteria bacterium]MCY4199180.1 deoxynucleoside kinase [Gammaproteobacteria bacterium]MCY4322060.1 deoxynucleoside kinase [Gammaproteobacteria bacterium]